MSMLDLKTIKEKIKNQQKSENSIRQLCQCTMSHSSNLLNYKGIKLC